MNRAGFTLRRNAPHLGRESGLGGSIPPEPESGPLVGVLPKGPGLDRWGWREIELFINLVAGNEHRGPPVTSI